MVSPDKARKQIEDQLARIRRRTEKIDRDLRRENNPLDADWNEAAQIRENDEVLDALEHEGREAIAQLEAALERIRDGSYGKCAGCSEAISTERLEALPQATLCIDCARAAEAG